MAELGIEPVADPAEVLEARSTVLQALEHINPEQRAAIVLVDMEGYSVQEAAAILQCAQGTVKSRCARGRARLVPLLTTLRAGNQPAAPNVSATSFPKSPDRQGGATR